MKNKVITAIMGLLAVVSMGAAISITPTPDATALNKEDAKSYIPEDEKKDGQSELTDTFQTIIKVVIGILGLVAVAMIVYGGFKFTTSSGDATKVKSAKDTIMYGIIGLVVALLAYAIVNFVLDSVFKTSSGGSSGSGTDSNSDSSYLVTSQIA